MAAERAFDRLMTDFRPVAMIDADVRRARTLVIGHDGLRAPDALHLAIVERLGAALATFDLTLRDAATAIGIDVLIP